MITKKEKEDYLKNPNQCPKCKSTNISSDDFESDTSIAWRDVSCNDCTAYWKELFNLTDIMEG